jgi:hypothetical protein
MMLDHLQTHDCIEQKQSMSLLLHILGVFLESPTDFTVDAKSVTGSGAGRVECLLTSPSGRVVRCPVKNMADGTYQVQYAPYEQGGEIDGYIHLSIYLTMHVSVDYSRYASNRSNI